jgi:hypothetical protein
MRMIPAIILSILWYILLAYNTNLHVILLVIISIAAATLLSAIDLLFIFIISLFED